MWRLAAAGTVGVPFRSVLSWVLCLLSLGPDGLIKMVRMAGMDPLRREFLESFPSTCGLVSDEV